MHMASLCLKMLYPAAALSTVNFVDVMQAAKVQKLTQAWDVQVSKVQISSQYIPPQGGTGYQAIHICTVCLLNVVLQTVIDLQHACNVFMFKIYIERDLVSRTSQNDSSRLCLNCIRCMWVVTLKHSHDVLLHFVSERK